MDLNKYNGNVEIIAIGIEGKDAMFIINTLHYISIKINDLAIIAEMIYTPYDKRELKFPMLQVLDGVKERMCFIQYKDKKYIVSINNKDVELSSNLLQSFILSGFLKRFIITETERNYKPNILDKINNNQPIITDSNVISDDEK